ncbi:nonsense-mediated mRNA decay factor SMG7-like [Cylas formicarius]|uniref:nonsense-mediated mRNA decay factor SMG7-like n=1 Tax=Cylas formicarius TaxID=197179 RepID=UPI0029589D36|nr:nonsense-mediated mRNA decay factor SMG7-like [Cylas formicarius]
MGYKAAVQVLKQADDLKEKVARKSDLLNDSDAWTNQQKLQTIYHQVLVLDLEYALDRKVEQDLWNIGFKNHISHLQELARDKKNPKRSDFQALLTWALESASGFYLTLLQELCNSFDIELPFRQRGNIYGQAVTILEQTHIPQLASCSYICQYCLVHLGDIARYRNQRREAESFYKQAILVSPISGHPYNQLALLEASQGDKLSTVFYYIRGICVKNPFPASTTNLLSVLNSAIDKDCASEKIQTKMTVNEFIQLFLCTHGYFHTVTELKKGQLTVKSLNSVMTALVATQSFKMEELVKITIINLYALKHLGKLEELTQNELLVRDLILELIAGSLSAFLMPVYTLKMDDSLLAYYALPAVKFLMYFIQNKPDVLKCKVFKERMQIWPSLCKIVNSAQINLKGFNYSIYSKSPIREDKSLEGFLPLARNFMEFNFKEEIEDKKIEDMVRMKRIINFAIWLSDFDVDGAKLITRSESNGIYDFEPVLSQPDPTNDLLEVMKSFTISGVSETNKASALEKKAGILKPQGSLERAREEREVKKSEMTLPDVQKISDSTKTKRTKQNVALQSIFKKIEENKQVKFNVEEPDDKEKTVKFDTPPLKQPIIPPPPSNQFGNAPPPLRTQSFNQNHPAFPHQSLVPPQQQPQQPPPQSDYLTSLRNLSKGEPPQLMPQFGKNPAFSNLTAASNQQSAAVNVPNYPPPFNVPPPQFNNWSREEVKMAPQTQSQGNWWGQSPSQSGFGAPAGFTVQSQNYSGAGQSFAAAGQKQASNFPNYPNQSVGFPPQRQEGFGFNYSSFGPPPYQNGGGTVGQFDVFPPTWNRGNFAGDAEGVQSSMSMRQAMLKEANLPGGNQSNMGRMVHTQQNMAPPQDQQTQGYSLFNNSWTPNLPSHLRSNKNVENAYYDPQHSLFGGFGPKSLAQLLEHQQNQMGSNGSNTNRGVNKHES